MLKRQKEVLQHHLDSEEAILQAIEKHYRDALEDINMAIRIMQTDELTQSKIYRINYQQALKKQVEGILEKLHSDEFTTLQQFLSSTYTDAFVGTMYDLHAQKVPVIIPVDRNAAVKAVLTDTKLTSPMYDELGIDINGLKKTIRAEITRGIASGMTYDDIARNISSVAKAPMSRAKNIARTEGHRIQQASTDDARMAAKAKGADVVKQWDSTMDGATRPVHRELDGQIREVDEPFEAHGKKAMYPGGFGDPAEDCNCRCAALTRARKALDADELKVLQERAKFFGLDKSDDFEDFKKKYLNVAEMEIDNKLNKPKRPKRSDYGDEETYDEARLKYRADMEAYKERLEKWADVQMPETAMTRKQIDEWCAKNNIELRSIEGMDLRAFNSFTQRWDELSNAYPLNGKMYLSPGEAIDIRQAIAYVHDTSFYAEASQGMTFGAVFDDFRTVLKKFGEQMSSGVNVWGSGSINTLFDHEYGHSVYAGIKYAEGMSVEKRLALKDDLIATCLGKDGISEYAHTNDDELFAEGFAAYFGGENTEFAKAFGQFLGRWYK